MESKLNDTYEPTTTTITIESGAMTITMPEPAR
jgi:hypothetical protein